MNPFKQMLSAIQRQAIAVEDHIDWKGVLLTGGVMVWFWTIGYVTAGQQTAFILALIAGAIAIVSEPMTRLLVRVSDE